MYWYPHGMGGGWGSVVMAITMLAPIAVLALTLIVVWRILNRPEDHGSDHTGQILADRFARGEIDDEEYRRRRAGLAVR